ncbi:hypothetical protein M8C21_009338, partial [Ambrosia artemisiifolia]
KSSAEYPDSAKKGCNDTCGGVTIPYPFGIGANCSLNKWYIVDCNSSTPYLSAFNNMEVVKVSLEEQTVHVNVSVTSRCGNSVGNSDHIPSIDLTESPFLFSGSRNRFTVKGCGYAALLTDGEVITGCSTTCTNDTALNDRDGCFGLGCCQTTLRYNLKSYTMDLTGLRRLGEDGACRSAFVGDELWYENTSFLPVLTLIWVLTDHDISEIPNCWQKQSLGSTFLPIRDGYIPQRKCSCGAGRVGNPYLHYQCEEPGYCRDCRESGATCQSEPKYPDEYDGTWTFNCKSTVDYTYGSSKSPLGIILGVSICMGLLFLAKFIYELHKLIKKTIAKRQKQKFFKRNGGLLLKQQQATKED